MRIYMKDTVCARERGPRTAISKTLLIKLSDLRDTENILSAARPNKQKPKSKSGHSYRVKIEPGPALFNAKQCTILIGYVRKKG